uniref:Uncharacterized protein n=1 Tax=Siphoviridae sp. ct2vX3 TaxID=2825318 RepID=A0A8S5PXT8_9CAUD|nr:MAG TPA: hypothetical protein [Siphoviridae sp. ct2vX3]
MKRIFLIFKIVFVRLWEKNQKNRQIQTKILVSNALRPRLVIEIE